MFTQECLKINSAFKSIPFLTGITCREDYENALLLMDELIDDYDSNRVLIQVLSTSINEWEQSDDELADFNQNVDNLDSGVALLRTLMDQHGIGLSDLPEIGSKSNVSKILNMTDGKKLTRAHIEALSKRFNISPNLFF